MQDLLEKLAYIELVAGALITLIAAFNMGSGFYYRDWGLTIIVLCSGAFATAVGYALLGGFSELLNRADLIYKLLEKCSEEQQNKADTEQEESKE